MHTPSPRHLPFDLAKAKAGHPLITQDGKRAWFVAHVPQCGEPYRVLAFVEGDDRVSSFYENGKLLERSTHDSDLFLEAKSEKLETELFLLFKGEPLPFAGPRLLATLDRYHADTLACAGYTRLPTQTITVEIPIT